MRKFFALLALAFVLVSCDDKPEDKPVEETNPFVGTWENDNGFRTVFTATYVTCYDNNGDLHWKGTYTYNDTHITVTLDYAVQIMTDTYGNIFTPTYWFVGDILALNASNFTKINN